MKLCPKCTEKYETGKFCPNCGTELVEETKGLYCSCGNKIEPNMKFCPECGAKVNGNVSTKENNSKAHEYLQIGLNDNDCEKAFSYCKKALEIDNRENIFSTEEKCKLFIEIAIYYESGLAGEEDPKKAFEFYNKASELGSSDAKVNIAMCYRDGIGVSKNESKAFKYFESAAKLENSSGYYWLGHCYLEGSGTVKNPEKAFESFKFAAKLGENYAYYWLGLCYENGFGCVENPEKAFDSFKNAYDSDEEPDADTKFELGYCYICGYGCNEDIEKGLELINEAAEEDCEEAQEFLTELKDSDDANEITNSLANFGKKTLKMTLDAAGPIIAASAINALKSLMGNQKK